MAKERPIDRLLAALGEHKYKGGWYTCHCPAHEDSDPSLRLQELSDGSVRMKCMSAGCATEQILDRIGMTKRDLFPAKDPNELARRRARKLLVKGNLEDGHETHVYPYQNLEGKTLYEVVRIKLSDGPDGKPRKEFRPRRWTPNRWQVTALKACWYLLDGHTYRPMVDAKGHHLTNYKETPETAGAEWFDEPDWVLYRLAEVAAAIKEGEDIYLVEGEKDADRVRRECATATTNWGGADSWKIEYTHQIAGAKRVVMVCDRDLAGMRRARKMREALGAEVVGELVFVQAASGKDAYDHLEAGHSLADLVPVDVDAELARLEAEKGSARPQNLGAEDSAEGQPKLEMVEGGASRGGSAREAKRRKKGGPPEGGEPENLPPLPDGWKQPTSDLDNFDMFLERAGDDIRYCHAMAKFLSWDTTRWRIEKTGGAIVLDHWQPLARTIEDMAPKAAAAASSDGLKKLIMKHRAHCVSAGGLGALMTYVKQSSRLAVDPDELDGHPDLLPCRNMTIDLRTGKPVANARPLLMTKRVEVVYDETAECETWVRCLEQWTAGDVDMQRFLFKMAGYWLTGHTRARKFFFFIGPTGSGKSTFVGTFQRLLGEYAVVLNKREIMTKNSETVPENIAELKGRRLSVTPEVNSSDKFDEGLMLQLSGEDKVRARYMRQDGFEFDATHKMVMFGNSRPGIYQQGDAMWNRIVPVPFEQQMIGDVRDDGLKAKLATELPGILAWAVAGAAAWYAEGLGEPEAVSALIAEYKDDYDSIGQFLKAATAPAPGGYVRGRSLYTAYQHWCKESGESKPKTETAFGRALGDRPGIIRDRKEGVRIYREILIKGEFETPEATT